VYRTGLRRRDARVQRSAQVSETDGRQNCWLCPLRERCALAALLREAGIEGNVEGEAVDHAAGSVFGAREGWVCVLRSGAVKVLWNEDDRRARVIDFRFAGEFVGLDASLGVEPARRSYMTVQWTRLCALRGAAGAPPLPAGLLASRLAAAILPVYSHHRMMQAGARERVAAYLVRAFDALEQGGGWRPGLLPSVARSDIADYLGLRPESVSRALAQFRDAGWIGGKVDSIEVRRADPLRELAESAR
jgi:CRP/FNR family transcriptional regulator